MFFFDFIFNNFLLFYLLNICLLDVEFECFFLFDIDRYYGDILVEIVFGKVFKIMFIFCESYVVLIKCGRYGFGFDFSVG